jgi:HlyD family secretion protein
MRVLHKTIIYSVGGVVALGAIATAAYFATPTVGTHYIAVPVTRMNLTEVVTGTGKVQADQEATLAFDQNGGTIAAVNVSAGDQVKKGQVLGSIKSDILEASLASAQANVTAAEAQLSSLGQGASPATIALYSQKTNDAQTALSSAMHDAYLKTEDALQNKVDLLFSNAGTVNPQINIWTQNQTIATNINNRYLIAGEKLTNWKADLDAGNMAKAESDASDAISYIKSFLFDLGTIGANLTTSNSGLPQTVIDTDRTTINSAASETTDAASEYTSAYSAWIEANASLTLEQSSSTPDTIAAQNAAIAAAEAQVSNIQAQINHTTIVAPFDGVITDVEPKVGEVFAAGVPAFTIQSNGFFKVEVYVSETDVAKIAVGNSANITLSAYGSAVLFPATVTDIDPASTIINGVNSYKITLHFTAMDPRILSGMTANVSITAGQASNVIAVPSSAVITDNSNSFVISEAADGSFARKQVTTGIVGVNGTSTVMYTEITSGLSDGDNIASFGNNN